MSLRSIYTNWLYGKTAAGVECTILPDGGCTFNLVLLQKEGNKIKIENASPGISSFSDLSKKIPGKTPVYLVLNGKGVIHRPLQSESRSSMSLHEILPGAKAEDFCVQTSANYFSIFRSASLENIVDQFEANGISVIDCTLGPFRITSLLPLLEVGADAALTLGRHEITLSSGEIGKYRWLEAAGEDKQYTLGGEKLAGSLLVAFSSALQHFSRTGTAEMLIPVRKQREEFFQGRIFRTLAASGLGLLLVLLSINYFAFTHYSKKHDELSAKLSLNHDLLQQLDTLKRSIASRKDFLQNKGLLESSRTSWYSDQISVDLPPGIRLERMNINPFSGKADEADKAEFRQKMIFITGNCAKSSELHEWIKVLKQKSWVKRVSLIGFSQDKMTEQGSFEINVEIA